MGNTRLGSADLSPLGLATGLCLKIAQRCVGVCVCVSCSKNAGGLFEEVNEEEPSIPDTTRL